MSNDPAVRLLRLPPANLNETKIPYSRKSARNWFRVHQSRFPAIHFSVRPFHRFSHPDSPYRILYLATDVETCLFERFGDKVYDQEKAIALTLWQVHSVSV